MISHFFISLEPWQRLVPDQLSVAISQEDADFAKLQNERKGLRNPRTTLVSFVIYGIKIKRDFLNQSFRLTLGGLIRGI